MFKEEEKKTKEREKHGKKRTKARTGRETTSGIDSEILASGSGSEKTGTRRGIFENQGNRESNALLETVRWLTSSEAAQYLRVSMSSLKTMIYRGQVRVRKLGNRNRFLREELERLIILPVYR